MTENEYKIMLTAEQYDKIHALYDWDKEITQTNFYYDTKELKLSELHITCRVRQIGSDFFLQAKLPAGELHNGAMSRTELEKRLCELPREISGEELSRLCGIEKLPDVKLLGELKTYRSVKRFNGAEIDLDKSEYFGRTDYELEVEYTSESEAEKILTEITAEINIDRNSEIIGKIRRFLNEYLKGQQ